MNNIELRLTAERNWREENLQKCINHQGKKTSNKSVWTLMNSFPSFVDLLLSYNMKVLKN